MSVFEFALPHMPVPLHACFVNVRRNGRADSDRYKTFKANTDQFLARKYLRLGTVKKPLFVGPVHTKYVVKRPDKRARDLGNLLKALDDTLTRNHIIADDSNIVDLRIRWARQDDTFDGSVLVNVRAA